MPLQGRVNINTACTLASSQHPMLEGDNMLDGGNILINI